MTWINIKKTHQFLEKFCGPYECVYEPFFAGFEENVNKIALRNPFYFNLKKVVLRC
ncbi:hypothetical protein [Flavobacterium sp.]|uniref:hypothetical protein n=1 Tax=Flavobacterium sp. TaxID=239 RepID=UPI002B4AC12A|nr:hypothetical protein [Flavobacterium sp.]HLF52597.1 hypothetical protein [Flavobacterium sp.]